MEIIEEPVPSLNVATEAADNNIYFDNVGLSYTLLALMISVLVALFVFSKKFFAQKKVTKA